MLDQLPFSINISHILRTMDTWTAHQHDPYAHLLTLDAKLNLLTDKNADCIYNKQYFHTGLFPTWVPDTHVAMLY
jgi:hypothetical protein